MRQHDAYRLCLLRCWSQSPPEITASALDGSDPLAVEAVDMFLGIIGAEAGAMALRCLAKGKAWTGPPGAATTTLSKLLPWSLHQIMCSSCCCDSIVIQVVFTLLEALRQSS